MGASQPVLPPADPASSVTDALSCSVHCLSTLSRTSVHLPCVLSSQPHSCNLGALPPCVMNYRRTSRFTDHHRRNSFSLFCLSPRQVTSLPASLDTGRPLPPPKRSQSHLPSSTPLRFCRNRRYYRRFHGFRTSSLGYPTHRTSLRVAAEGITHTHTPTHTHIFALNFRGPTTAHISSSVAHAPPPRLQWPPPQPLDISQPRRAHAFPAAPLRSLLECLAAPLPLANCWPRPSSLPPPPTTTISVSPAFPPLWFPRGGSTSHPCASCGACEGPRPGASVRPRIGG